LCPLDFDDSNKRKTGMASGHFQPRSTACRGGRFRRGEAAHGNS
jgi:hypothetical protein